MLFHEFGEHGIVALGPGFELLDLAFPGVLDGLGLAAVAEGGLAVLEEFLEPGVELLGGVEVEFIAQVRDGDLVEEMPLEDGDLRGAGEVTMLLGRDAPPLGLC